MAAECTNIYQLDRSQQKALRFFVNRNSENSTKILEAEVEINFQAAKALYGPALRFAFLTSYLKSKKQPNVKN